MSEEKNKTEEVFYSLNKEVEKDTENSASWVLPSEPLGEPKSKAEELSGGPAKKVAKKAVNKTSKKYSKSRRVVKSPFEKRTRALLEEFSSKRKALKVAEVSKALNDAIKLSSYLRKGVTPGSPVPTDVQDSANRLSRYLRSIR